MTMTDNATELESSIRDEVTHWFFDDYLTTWIGVGAGPSSSWTTGGCQCIGPPKTTTTGSSMRLPWWRACRTCKLDCVTTAMPTPQSLITGSGCITVTARRSR